ncbi:hypothetical protein LTR85_010931 [Meristemomyces frigidus]|nr:hypothetical protein LTR85_010931 [Meristemomyces frigidus]
MDDELDVLVSVTEAILGDALGVDETREETAEDEESVLAWDATGWLVVVPSIGDEAGAKDVVNDVLSEAGAEVGLVVEELDGIATGSDDVEAVEALALGSDADAEDKALVATAGADEEELSGALCDPEMADVVLRNAELKDVDTEESSLDVNDEMIDADGNAVGPTEEAMVSLPPYVPLPNDGAPPAQYPL